MELLRQGRCDEAAALVAHGRGGVRVLTARLWDSDEAMRRAAAVAFGDLAEHAPDKLREALRRFIWALNDESGTDGSPTLAAMAAVAQRQPRALAPFLGALIALLDDGRLRPGILSVLERVAATDATVLAASRHDLVDWAESLDNDRLAALAARLEGGNHDDQAK